MSRVTAPVPAPEGKRRPPGVRRMLVGLGVVFTVVAGGVGAVALLGDRAVSETAVKEKNCCWEKGVTPAGLSDRIGIRIPAEATDRKAAVKTNSRYSTGLLAFTLPEDTASGYLSRMVPEDTEMIANIAPKPDAYKGDAPFTHLVLTEPETITSKLRKTALCPEDTETSEGKYLRGCVDIYAHDFEPGSTRIYVRSSGVGGQ
ncbi:hypothetical protein [Streptomyces sp. SID4982]|uniref:hypothetical protein n=1 Tax=Streptomyces sp. SID4982 TaxID=2690291 RepID=UPI001371EF97|nr:hypothetical protein [Streptomyces sp. SID4982]MYS15819.1 hypothetical protein [Streptomyces sp. SID4982]